MVIMLTLLVAVWNETLVQGINDMVGIGMTYAFGNALFIGLFILFFVLGTLYMLGFTIDVTMVVITAFILAMVSLPVIAASYPTLPNWMSSIPLFIIAMLLVYALMKLFRR